jgi:dihydroflavonol-4-reductase
MQTSPIVLVTGANGFLGSHIVQQLLRASYRVRVFILEGTSTTMFAGLDLEIITGNLLSKADLHRAISGCDYVIHTAAVTDVWPAKNVISWKINYEVVTLMYEVMSQLPIKKWIHIGTANSFGFGNMRQPGNERTPFQQGMALFDYIVSKKAAQDFLIAQHHQRPSVPIVILNPTFMIGEADRKPGSGAMIVSLLKRKVPGFTKGGRSFAPVKDVAHAAVQALTKGQPGSCYIVGGTNMTYQNFFQLVSRIANVKPPKRYIPSFLAVITAFFMELIAKIKNKPPLLTVAMARLSSQGHYYDSSKAIAELGYEMTRIETAVEEAITWFRKNGYVPNHI